MLAPWLSFCVCVCVQAELGAAGSTKRPTSCVLIAPPKAGFDYQKKFDKVVVEVKTLAPVY